MSDANYDIEGIDPPDNFNPESLARRKQIMTTTTAMPPRGTARPAAGGRKVFGRSKGITRAAWKAGIFGPEGTGKSTLASLCPGVVFLDLEHGTQDLNVERVTGVETWFDLRAFVGTVTPEEFPVVCIDSMTRAEDWCAQYVIETKVSGDGIKAKDSIEDFKYKAGLTFVTDEFRRLLADIDAAFLRGVSFIMVAHNRIGRVRNPDGSDFIRNEPRLINEEKGSNMLPWVQFLDHCAFIDYDVAVTKGKATGSGSRTIYTTATPNRIAKSRSLPDEAIVYGKGDAKFWDLISGKQTNSDAPPL